MNQQSRQQSAILFEGVGKTYLPSPPWMKVLLRSAINEPVVALENVNFEVPAGEICAIVGPNGAGKTTAFRIITGLTTQTAGRAQVLGHDTTSQSVDVRRLIGWVPAEDRSLMMRLSCGENLQFHGRLHRMDGERLKRRITETLDIVGLGGWEDASIFALSAGMKARLQLARSLLHEPRVLVLDEPTASIDPVAAYELLELLVGLVKSEGLSALISSHRLEEIEALHSHVILLDRGHVLYDGDLEELRGQWDQRVVEMTFASPESTDAAKTSLQASGHRNVVGVGERNLELAVQRNFAIGDLLVPLSDLVPELLYIGERHIPLRDLLADMYSRNQSDE